MNEYKRICKECGVNFIARNSRAIFCSGACKTKEFRKNKKEYNQKCVQCEKEFISKEKKTKFCSFVCAGKHKNLVGNGKFYFCKNCGEKFSQKHKRNLYCSSKCKKEYGYKNQAKQEASCSNCERKILVAKGKIKKQSNFFCCRACESDFREKSANDKRICENCSTEFYCKKHDKLRFCSMKCQSEWQKKNTGKNNSHYKHEITDEMRLKNCETCGREMVGTPKSFETKKYCSYSCKVKANPRSLTFPHRRVLDILKKIDVGFDCEVQVGRYSVDVFVLNTNLIIEVMGTFWHCDNREYDFPISDIQNKSIKRDKSKKERIYNNNLIPLYIWEKDICDEYEKCEKIIYEFIKRNGSLYNYHSMNYLVENGKLKLRSEILIPYFER